MEKRYDFRELKIGFTAYLFEKCSPSFSHQRVIAEDISEKHCVGDIDGVSVFKCFCNGFLKDICVQILGGQNLE